MSLALSSDPTRRYGFFHLHKFHSNRWQRNNLRIFQHVQHLLQRINRCNNATLITHFCPIGVIVRIFVTTALANALFLQDLQVFVDESQTNSTYTEPRIAWPE